MNSNFTRRALAAMSTGVMLCAAGGAHAGLFRAYLSVNGNDASACALQTPCRLLPAALAAINAGGEIWMLDSASFNAAPNITKSATILASAAVPWERPG